MRIIGGSARGRRIAPPRGNAIRPTADRVREALFNILPRDLGGMRVLDLFAGSGSLSLEALSRGAESALLVDESAAAAKLIRRNAAALGFTARAQVWTRPVGKALSRLADQGAAYDAIFLDPPYDGGWAGDTLAAVARAGTLREDGVAVVEHSPREQVAEQYGSLVRRDRRQYGDTVLSFFGIDNQDQVHHMAETSIAVYPGSFDPITNGHIDLVRRTLRIFDQVIIAIARNQDKGRALFTVEERMATVRKVFESEERVCVDSFEGLLVDYAEALSAKVVIRGLRAVSDFEYEFQMATMNRRLKPNIETFFMMTSESSFYISSRLVKEVAGLGGDVAAFVPEVVLNQLREKFPQA